MQDASLKNDEIRMTKGKLRFSWDFIIRISVVIRYFMLRHSLSLAILMQRDPRKFFT